jgi:hypothetical protein
MSNHTIKVFAVFLPDATVHLQYIHHQEDHPTEDAPGHPVSIVPGDKIRWKSMSGAPITVTYKASPFISGDLNLPTNKAQNTTIWETVAEVPPAGDGSDPDFKYSVTIAGVPLDDPDLIVDLSGGGPKIKKPKKVKGKPSPKHKSKK